MKIIELTRGIKASVDDDDYDWITCYKWRAHSAGNKFYAVRNIRGSKEMVYMHREIMKRHGIGGDLIEHIDGDGTNNQKSNLRVSTHSRNHLNEEFDGVTVIPANVKRKYAAKLVVNKEVVFWKSFLTYEEAKQAYLTEKKAYLDSL